MRRSLAIAWAFTAACAAPADPPAAASATLRLADVTAATMDFWEDGIAAPVPFSGEQCRAFAPLLATAQRRAGPPTNRCIHTHRGVLTTDRGDWSVAVAEHKLGNTSVGITLVPLGENDGREQAYFEMTGEPSRRFLTRLEQAVRAEAKKLPPVPKPAPFRPLQNLVDAIRRHHERPR